MVFGWKDKSPQANIEILTKFNLRFINFNRIDLF
jgi:hypothetical protein